MTRSLLNLVNDLSEETHKIKCKFVDYNKKLKHLELNISIATVSWNA